jgi:hypothetical protein
MSNLTAETADMWARDNAAHALGIELLDVGDNTASLSLIIGPQHLNSHAICHGGVIFTLADCAFAYASNAGTEMAVAQANSITYRRFMMWWSRRQRVPQLPYCVPKRDLSGHKTAKIHRTATTLPRFHDCFVQ